MTRAVAKDLRISAQKVRLVVDMIRGLPVDKALAILRFSPKKAARLVAKVLYSAIANAEHNDEADIDALYVTCAYVDEGHTMKRFRARAKGRSDRILKRSSHVTIEVNEIDTEAQ